jgi:hypothetical protein
MQKEKERIPFACALDKFNNNHNSRHLHAPRFFSLALFLLFDFLQFAQVGESFYVMLIIKIASHTCIVIATKYNYHTKNTARDLRHSSSPHKLASYIDVNDDFIYYSSALFNLFYSLHYLLFSYTIFFRWNTRRKTAYAVYEVKKRWDLLCLFSELIIIVIIVIPHIINLLISKSTIVI